MNAVIWGKWKQFIRNPGSFIITTFVCIIFAFLVGKSTFTKIEVPVFAEPSLEAEEIVNALNTSESYSFVQYSEDAVKKKVEEGKADVGIILSKDSYTVYREAETSNVLIIGRFVDTYYKDMLQKREIIQQAENQEAAKSVIKENEENPLLPVKIDHSLSEGEITYNQSLQALFGFTLFFSIYTVAFTVVEILREKQQGIWDRFILSATTKTQLYLGHLFFSFLMGYIQIMIIFSIFQFFVGVDFGGNFYKLFILIIPYLYSIVALTILLTGLVKTVSQFNAVVPLISVSFAMLGGAYWPIEIVTSQLMLTISKFIPVTYGMEVLKLAIIENAPLTDVLMPVGILLLMGTIMLGIGIQIMEKRHV